jgi:hypothetical protein
MVHYVAEGVANVVGEFLLEIGAPRLAVGGWSGAVVERQVRRAIPRLWRANRLRQVAEHTRQVLAIRHDQSRHTGRRCRGEAAAAAISYRLSTMMVMP